MCGDGDGVAVEQMAYEFCVCVCNSVQCTEDERLVQYVKEKEKIRKEIKVVCIVFLKFRCGAGMQC
jgi:hypothetical protein